MDHNNLQPNSNLDALFYPKSVAVVGASENPAKIGHEILKNIKDSGFPGKIYPINPKSKEILGLTCHKSVLEVKEPIDLAVIIIPARFVPSVVEECGQKEIKAAVVITGGFSEAGPEGEALQKEVERIAQLYGIRVVGPNCQGINNPYCPLCASWPLLTGKGRVAVISQSGTVGAAMMDWFSEEHLGVSCFVSMGNRVDVEESDLIGYLDQDPNTQVIALYIEGVKNPARFFQVLKNIKKPLVVLKSGRTPKGRVAAESHTKSLAGSDAVYEALFKRFNVHRADTIEEFYDFSKALAYLPSFSGNRILFITTSGGAAILATDQAEKEGLDVAAMPDELSKKLEPVVPAHSIRANPLDLTGDADAEMFKNVVQVAKEYYDILGLIFGDPVEDANEVASLTPNNLVIFLGGAEVERKEKLIMHEKGIPVFPTPERGIKALAKVMPKAIKKAVVHTDIRTSIVSQGQKLLPPSKSLELLASFGFPCSEYRVADTPGKVAHAAYEMGFPVAIKINSSVISHKSDLGCVKLGITSGEDAKKCYHEIVGAAKKVAREEDVTEVLVMPMAKPGLETIFGMIRDVQFGPVIMFGIGGIAVEIYQDVVFRLLPLDRPQVERMIGEIKAAPILDGYRGQPAVDKEAIVNGLLILSHIATERPDIAEIDVNPVIAYPDGMMAVDARVLLS